MMQLLGTLAVAVALCVAAVVADEIKGKITKVDADGRKITLAVDGKDTEYTVSDDCKMPKTKGKDGAEKTQTLKGLAKQLERSKSGSLKATLTTAKKGGKETVVEIKTEGGGKKKDS